MQVLRSDKKIPVYRLEPDTIAHNPDFRVYNFTGSLPHQADLLIPHRKDHFLLVFIRKARNRQWIDRTPYTLRDHTVYFTGPDQIIIKEGFSQLWSTGIAFTKAFLSLQENVSLSRLPLVKGSLMGHELLLSETNVAFVEDMLEKINVEYTNKNSWQHRMLTAYLTVLLTYLSRLYTEQYPASETNSNSRLLKEYQTSIDENFRDLHEVKDYASLLHISAGHLSEMVKLHTGKPAIKHIHERIVLEAQRLLLHTSHTLKEIAFDLGFTDASYFNRFFKREMGKTPSEYRHSIREMYH